jgi:Phage protein U
MLMQLGATTFEVWPMNTHETAFSGEATHVDKPVMGRRPPLEFVGEGPDTRTLSCRLFPAKFGGLSSLAGLHQQRLSGAALPLVRGDGTPLGWYVIERITERATYLDPHGVGQVIEVDLALKRADPPSAGSVFSIIIGLLG